MCNCYNKDLKNLKYEINKRNLKPILKIIKDLYMIQKQINAFEDETINILDSIDEENRILINSILENIFNVPIFKTNAPKVNIPKDAIEEYKRVLHEMIKGENNE